MKEYETQVTMFFLPVDNKVNIDREFIDNIFPCSDEDLKDILKRLKKIKGELTLVDWGVHDIDDDDFIQVPIMDAELFNSLDDNWKDYANEDDIESFADALSMDVDAFKGFMIEHWALALPLSVEESKKRLGL